MQHYVGDLVGLLDALGAETAVIAGHDTGGPIAWQAALQRPDRFRRQNRTWRTRGSHYGSSLSRYTSRAVSQK